MGLFNRKSKSDVTASGSASAPSGSTVGWVLRGGGVCAFKADPSWAEVIRASTPKVARVGHGVTVELRRDAAKNVTVWFDGQQVGVMSPEDSKAYASALDALERSKRHGVVDARIEPTDWKSAGAAFLDIAPPQRPCIPFNQPPAGVPRAGRADFEVKDEAKFKDYIMRISRQMNASPGFFVIAPADASGLHPVYSPLNGVTESGSQVGYINKAGTKAAAEVTANGPVYLPGMVWWRDKTPQVELASWLG
jgi:hypothetical protein